VCLTTYITHIKTFPETYIIYLEPEYIGCTLMINSKICHFNELSCDM